MGRRLTIVLNSALTDMAAVLRDPRWDELAPGVVQHVVAMGGIVLDGEGAVRIDPNAANNSFDLESAVFVYSQLQADPRVQFSVVTRHAASACQLPKKALDGSAHPIALRLTAVAKPSLQKLWVRAHRSEAERLAMRDALPMSRDPIWFRNTFLEASAPTNLGSHDDIWPYVRGFNEYDGLTTVVAVTTAHPELFSAFFTPYRCAATGTLVIGLDPSNLGIADTAKASELLHDLLVTAFSAERFRKGFKVELRTSPLSETWSGAMLKAPARGHGPDCWIAVATEAPSVFNGALTTFPVYLSRSTEGILWRLAHRFDAVVESMSLREPSHEPRLPTPPPTAHKG